MNRFYTQSDAYVALEKLKPFVHGKELAVLRQFEDKYYFIGQYIDGTYKPLPSRFVAEIIEE